jgi:hypothetical protein
MVDTETMLVMVPVVTQASNDKQQVEPMLEKLKALPEGLNAPDTLLADAGYFSADNVEASLQVGIEPLIATGRASPTLAGTICRTETDCRRGQFGGHDEAHAQDATRADALRTPQANSRAGVRHHQVGDEVPPVHAARIGQCKERMDAGVLGVESEAHGRIAPGFRPMGLKGMRRRSNPMKTMP